VSSRSSTGQLRGAVVLPVTSAKYKKYMFWFFDFCHECGIPPPNDPGHMDTLMSEYMEWLYESDYKRASAEGAYYGLLHFFPRFKRNLPEAEMTLRGWDLLYPGQSYPPLTWNLTVLIAFQLRVMGHHQAAIAVLLSFDCFLRITECVSLVVQDVAIPWDPRLGVRQAWMALSLRHTKTGKNQWVTITRPEVATILNRHLIGMSSTDFLFPMSASALRALFHQACVKLDIYRFGYTPHSLRHGAATHDCLAGYSVEDIMRRGRWASGKSARLYIQQGRSLLLGLRVPKALDDQGHLIASNLTAWFGC
jgi:integrase